jgi:superfamily II DNA or RNA helicase
VKAPRFRGATPREVALAMLDARFGVAQTADGEHGLAAFQQEALARVTTILRRRRGAILADSVGLGKTHVAAALIRRVTGEGGTVLVSGPAVLHAHWRRHLRHVRRWRWCSHTSLSRGSAPAGAAWRLVVVDEAHAFRNPETHRYRVLVRLCTDADVLLLTATPVNNTLLDLYHLIRLFAGDGAFHDIGVADLRAAFDAASRSADARDVRRVAEAVMVRRTRSFVRRCHGTGELGLRFPETAPARVLPYDLDAGCEGGVPALLERVMALRFPAHAVMRDAPATALLRLGLLKRLESGRAALRASLRRHLRLVDAFESALRDGFVLDAREYRLLAAGAEDATQLLLAETVLRRAPPDRDAARAAADAAHDRALLHELLRALDVASPDPKLAALLALLGGELSGERVLVFTEFRETASAIWRALRGRFRCGLIHGTAAFLGPDRAGRRTVIERFAPYANGVRAPPARERVDVLVTTDVLAEGLNLQDACVVISYDLPWNPVRLAQRIGRVDRLGSPHERIEVVTFSPDRRLETLLGLMRRLRRKLRAIRLVGGDAPPLGGGTSLRIMDRKEWETVEELRTEHRRARTAHGHLAGASLDVPAAAVEWGEPRPAVLCCTALGDVARLHIVADRRRVVEGDARIDRVLLHALRDSSARAMDERRLRRAAAAALRELNACPPAVTGRGSVPLRRAASLVHRWLDSRPVAPADADCARADRLLAGLRRSADPRLLDELAGITAGGGSLDTRIERLDAALARAPPCGAEPPAPRLVALLELLPHGADATS